MDLVINKEGETAYELCKLDQPYLTLNDKHFNGTSRPNAQEGIAVVCLTHCKCIENKNTCLHFIISWHWHLQIAENLRPVRRKNCHLSDGGFLEERYLPKNFTAILFSIWKIQTRGPEEICFFFIKLMLLF